MVQSFFALSLLAAPAQYDNAAAARDVAALQAIVKANSVNLGTLQAANRQASAIESRMRRCDILATRAAAALGEVGELLRARRAALDGTLITLLQVNDLETEVHLSPLGQRERAAFHDYRMCVSEGVTLAEPERTCVALEEPIADLALAREGRWLTYLGLRPAIPDKKAQTAYSAVARAKRKAFEIAEAARPEGIELTSMQRRQQAACTHQPTITATTEPVW